MPEYIEYLIISLVALALIMAVLLVVVILKVQYLRQYFNSRKFKLSMKLEVDPVTHKDKFVFYIFNNNLNDARVTDLGIGYDQESITFYNEVLKKQQLEVGDWLIITTRDSVSIDIDVAKTYQLILERNKGIYRLKKVRVYVIDSSGFETRVRARDFVKTLKKMLKADRKVIAFGKRQLRMEKLKAFFDFKNRGKVTPTEVKHLEPGAFKENQLEEEMKVADVQVVEEEKKLEVESVEKPVVEVEESLEKSEVLTEEKVEEVVEEKAAEKVEKDK